MMKKAFCLSLFIMLSFASNAQQPVNYGETMAKTVMSLWKDSMTNHGKPAKWNYDQGVILKGIEGALGTNRRWKLF